MTQLIRYDAARTALAEAHSIDEVKDIRDKSEAMAAYARQAKDVQLVQWATEIKVRAERKAGQMLAEMPKAVGGNPNLPTGHIVGPVAQTLSEIGITKNDSSRWQKLAAVSDEQFEHAVSAAKEVAGKVTTAAMLRAAKAQDDDSSPTPKPPKPKLLSEEESSAILAENERLKEIAETLEADAQSSLDDNLSMAKVFEADDQLAAATKEIDRLRAEVKQLQLSLNGKMNECSELNRLLKYWKRKAEQAEKAAA
jgi:uncharacterized small protein (DUF1192 family)